MFELISIVFLIIGLGAVIVGTTEIFGYSLMQLRQKVLFHMLTESAALYSFNMLPELFLKEILMNLKAITDGTMQLSNGIFHQAGIF